MGVKGFYMAVKQTGMSVAMDTASMPSRPLGQIPAHLLTLNEKGGNNMNALLGWLDEHYCYVCEEPLNINEEHLEFSKRVSSMYCSLCGRIYELEIPTTGNELPSLQMIGFGGEWE